MRTYRAYIGTDIAGSVSQENSSVKFRLRAKDPGSAITHFIGFTGAAAMTPFLLMRAGSMGTGTAGTVSAAVFMISMMILYAASTSYHTFDISEKWNMVLKRIDHMSIFILIAGSYTPFCLITLNGAEGHRLLAGIWALAALGMIFKLFWVTCPKWVSSVIYTGMGWMCLTVLPDMIAGLGRDGFAWLLAGGLFYTTGAVIYALKFDVFGGRFKNFGTHELFHVFVLAGSLCHYICVYFWCL